MNNKYLIFTATLFFILLPMVLFGSDGGSPTYKILKGDGAIEQWFLTTFNSLEPSAGNKINSAARLGRAIGSIGAMGYLAYLGWEMAEGQRPWAVTPMIKPMLVGFILINWADFAKGIKAPFSLIAEPSVTMFSELAEKADDLRLKRYELQRTLVAKATDIEAENNLKKEEERKATDDGMFDAVTDNLANGMDDFRLEIYKWSLETSSGAQLLFAEVIEAICLIILRVCVYGIFGFQKLWSVLLMILGPIAVGMSLIPGFDGALQSWVAKFININLWTFIAFEAMTIGNLLVTAGYQMEINRYESVLKGTEDEIIANVGDFVYGSGFINVIVITCVAYIVTGMLTLMTPTIADSIVSAGGSGIANAAKGAVSTMVNSAKSAGRGLQTSMRGLNKGLTKTSEAMISGAGKGATAMGKGLGNLASRLNK